ncbi:MAG: hypothetical protein Q8R18_02255 [bacterium]|nr:hypothetical protein [bacterium]
MVDFSPREKFKEVKDVPSENAEETTEGNQQRLLEQEDIEQRVREQQKNFLEQQIQEADSEQIQKPEIIAYQTNASQVEYSMVDNTTQKFWEEKRMQEQKEEEERRKRSVI